MSDTLSLGSEGSKSFAFDTKGDKVTGTIVSMSEIPQTDINSGAALFWPDGKPKTQFQVKLKTGVKDSPDDDGIRSVYLRGSVKPESKSSLAAVRVAVKAATGSYNLQVGAELTLEFSGEEASTQRGFNARKLYTAAYKAPSINLEPVAAPVPADWESDPRVAGLRAAGVSDAIIRSTLGV